MAGSGRRRVPSHVVGSRRRTVPVVESDLGQAVRAPRGVTWEEVASRKLGDERSSPGAAINREGVPIYTQLALVEHSDPVGKRSRVLVVVRVTTIVGRPLASRRC